MLWIVNLLLFLFNCWQMLQPFGKKFLYRQIFDYSAFWSLWGVSYLLQLLFTVKFTTFGLKKGQKKVKNDRKKNISFIFLQVSNWSVKLNHSGDKSRLKKIRKNQNRTWKNCQKRHTIFFSFFLSKQKCNKMNFTTQFLSWLVEPFYIRVCS